MKCYLVTGSAGFIGSQVARQLLEQGHRVIGVDGLRSELYPASDKVRRHEELGAFERFEPHVMDLRTHSIAGHLDTVDAVIHLAALAGLEGPGRAPESYFEHNVDATRAVLTSMAGRGIHLVFASTSSVYGAFAVGDESEPLAPVSAYGRSKVVGEELIGQYATGKGQSATILRLFSVYGPDQRPEMAFARACHALITGRTMSITGDGTQRRSNTFVTDAARAIVLAADQQPVTTLNISGGDSLSLMEAIALIARTLGVEPSLVFGPARIGDQVETKGDSSRARKILGWEPEVSIGEGLAEQAAWTRALLAAVR